MVENDKNNFVGVQEYLEYQGYPLGKPGSTGWAHVLCGHDSLYVNVDADTFKWHAKFDKGQNTLQNLMAELDGITDRDEQIELLKEIKSKRTGDTYQQPHYDVERVQFKIEEHELHTLSDASKEYLTVKRGIHPIIVDKLSQTGFLQENEKQVPNKKGTNFSVKNIWFAWRDEVGYIVGADEQGIFQAKKPEGKHQGYYKGIVTGSPAAKYGFNFRVGPNKAIPDKLIVCEGPIDAISYWQIHCKEIKDKQETVAFLSLSGSEGKEDLLNHYIERRYINWATNVPEFPKEIHFALDNDKSGRKFAKGRCEMLQGLDLDTKVFIDVPADLAVKDWNDQLRFGKTLDVNYVNPEVIDSIPLFNQKVEKPAPIFAEPEEPFVIDTTKHIWQQVSSVEKQQNKSQPEPEPELERERVIETADGNLEFEPESSNSMQI